MTDSTPETPEARAARHALDKPLIEAFQALHRHLRTRAELLQLKMVHGAAAAAAEAELKGRAAQLFTDEGSADTWRLPGGQVIVQLTNDRAEIVDREAFLAWLAAAYPHQVRTEVITVRTVINEKWLAEELLPTLTPLDPGELEAGEQTQLMDAEGTLVPGATWRKGGGLHAVSIRPDSTVARRLKAAAAAYIDGTGPLPLPGFEAASPQQGGDQLGEHPGEQPGGDKVDPGGGDTEGGQPE